VKDWSAHTEEGEKIWGRRKKNYGRELERRGIFFTAFFTTFGKSKMGQVTESSLGANRKKYRPL